MDETPSKLRPMLARTAAEPPPGEDWAFEIKWDGVRALAYLDGTTRLESRTGEDVTRRYPELAPLAEGLAGRRAILDGEIVAFENGERPSFQRLQARMGLTSEAVIRRRTATIPVTYIAFDVLYLDGGSTCELPYERRRELLEALALDGPNWQTPRNHRGDGVALLEATRERRLEGIVAKRLGSTYRPGRRSGDWLKVRNTHRQEFVIGGWCPGEGGRSGLLGSLLVGYNDSTPDEAGELDREPMLVFAGGVGTGFTNAELERLTAMLKGRARLDSPFDVGGPKRRAIARWCEPELVCEVEFREWTREGTLRAPSYKGLRDDKEPREVVRE